MSKIKFAHHYSKLPRDYRHSKLLQVLPVRLEDLSVDFLRYDTAYLDGGEERNYKLPKSGAYMILLLQAGSGCGQLWTTIRSQWPTSKLDYYRGLVGEVVDCEVEE